MRDMNYHKIYDRIIDRAKNRELTCYIEKHHIIPRCIGGSDDVENIAKLTPEEHYVCHQLLVKIHPSNRKLLYACQAMSMCGSTGVRSNKIYGWLRKKLSEAKKKDKIILSCKFCETSFLVHECNKHRVYCSKTCKSNDSRVTKVCPTCNNSFSKMKSKETVYCSLKCAKVNLKPPSQKDKVYGERITGTCVACKKIFTRLKCLGTPIYCSIKCKDTAHIKSAERLTHKCLNCDKEFLDYKSKGLRKFCCSICKYSFKSTKG